MRLSQSKVFLICLLAFVLGVGVASFASVPFVHAYGLLLVIFVLFVAFWSNRGYRILALWGIFFVLGALRFSLAQPDAGDPSHIAHYNGQDVVIQGVIGEEPDVRLDHQKLTIDVIARGSSDPRSNLINESGFGATTGLDSNDKIASSASTPPRNDITRNDMRGKLLVKAPLYPEYEYGDVLEVKCAIEAPEQIEDFAYDKYLARYDIYSVCWRGELAVIERGRGNPAMAGILFVKTKFMDSINQIISEPHAAFLAGLLVGARRGIPEYLLEAFNRTGTTHIIAISGSNITIIAAVIIGFMQFLGVSRKRAFWWISGGITVFVIMTGATASVVRAGIMGIFVLLARQLGRPSRATNALVFTAFMMLLVNPKILIFDAGFQLSFLATVGLVYINPILQKYADRMPELFGVKEALVTTISAMATTTPLILYQFGRLSLVAPLANILIIPAIPPTMAIGFAAATLGMLSETLGSVAAWPAWLLLEYMIRVAEGLSSLGFASLEFGNFHWVLMLALYACIWFAVWRYNQKTGSPLSRG